MIMTIAIKMQTCFLCDLMEKSQTTLLPDISTNNDDGDKITIRRMIQNWLQKLTSSRENTP